MEPTSFTVLGGVDKPTDKRDIKLGAAAAPVYTFSPALFDQTAWAMPVEYQRQQPACGAHSGTALEGIVRKSHFTPRFTWADIKSFDGIPLQSGTDMRSIFKSITKGGVLDFDLMGNETTLPLAEYVKIVVTTGMAKNAAQHKGFGYGFITDLSFNGIKQFLFDHGPAIMLMRVGNEMWTAPSGTTSWAEKDILPLRPPANIVSGHFVVIHSYDEKYIYFINSFSSGWGRQGHGYFGENYVPFINDVGALFPLAFTKDLYKGMTDPDVKRLQVILNKDPRTQLAISGAGSPGKETEYFGLATFGAVRRFQAIHKINATGYVGPLTRAILNEAL